jgi:DNA modification methylase
MSLKQIRRWWNNFNSKEIYDFEQHLTFLESLGEMDRLSKEYVTLPLRSNTPYIWTDVNRMHGLNNQQRLRKRQNHICPQPFDEPRRIITLYSNRGDMVGDGLCTTGVEALKQGRKAFIVELNETYAKCGAGYLAETEYKNTLPTLFDLITDINIEKQSA